VGVKDTLVLLKDKFILACFVGIVVLVAADAAVNMTLPRLMTDEFGLSTEKANLCNSLYFLARTIAAFAGGALLLKVSDKKFFSWGCWIAMAGRVLFAARGRLGLVSVLVAVCIFGVGYANLFGIVFSFAMRRAPEKANEVSALLIVGLIGGAILPPVLGWIRDVSGSQVAAVAAIAVVWIYMLWLIRRIREA
jgi:fucose permease